MVGPSDIVAFAHGEHLNLRSKLDLITQFGGHRNNRHSHPSDQLPHHERKPFIVLETLRLGPLNWHKRLLSTSSTPTRCCRCRIHVRVSAGEAPAARSLVIWSWGTESLSVPQDRITELLAPGRNEMSLPASPNYPTRQNILSKL
jgi:hypothetical protein